MHLRLSFPVVFLGGLSLRIAPLFDPLAVGLIQNISFPTEVRELIRPLIGKRRRAVKRGDDQAEHDSIMMC